MSYKVYVSGETDITEESECGCPVSKPSDNMCVQRCFSPWFILGRCGIYRGCGDGRITDLCQRNLPVNWEYCTACSIEAPCSCLWLVLSRCLGRELHICVSELWVLRAGVGCLWIHRCLPGVRGCRKLKEISGHLFSPFLAAEPASQSSQVACRNCKVISAFGAKICVWVWISLHLDKWLII